VAQFTAECLVQLAPERVAQFAAELVVGCCRNPHANVYLDAFDQHMKARGHRIVRYADDILIMCG
jgi:hypothetical protein